MENSKKARVHRAGGERGVCVSRAHPGGREGGKEQKEGSQGGGVWAKKKKKTLHGKGGESFGNSLKHWKAGREKVQKEKGKKRGWVGGKKFRRESEGRKEKKTERGPFRKGNGQG